MELPEHWDSDLLFFFRDHPLEYDLFQVLLQRLDVLLPDTRGKVQKSQISFYNRHLFAAASLPVRRRRGWPEHCLVVTLGLPRRLSSPRVAAVAEPCPNRWTHHILITRPNEIDAKLLHWLEEAYRFSMDK